MDLVERLINMIPFACAVHEYRRNGETADFIFKDVNEEFEKTFGLEKESILNRGISDIDTLRFQSSAYSNLTEIYMQLLKQHDKKEVTDKVKINGRYYEVNAFPLGECLFAAVFKVVNAEAAADDLLPSDFDIIFNSTQDSLFLVRIENNDFYYVRNNKMHQIITGMNAYDIEGKTPVEVLGKENGEKLLAKFRESVKTCLPISFNDSFDLPSGKKEWVTKITPIVLNGKPKYLLGSRVDITDVLDLHREKERILEQFQTMFNNHIAIMLVIEPLSGKIINANPAACEFYGYTRDELLRMNIQDINTLSNSEVEKERLKALQKESKYFLFPHKKKNGEIKFVDVYSYPVNIGNDTLLYSIIFDVSDREKYKEDLYRERELLDITLHSIGDGVVTTDMNAVITDMNSVAEDITGWHGREAINKPFHEIFRLQNEKTGEPVEDIISIVLKTGRVVGLANHTVLVNKSGRRIAISDSAAPIKNEEGQIFGSVLIFRDVSKEKEHQEQILFMSYHDPLTGLYNRRYLDKELNFLDTPLQLPLAVIMGDVNGLKITNDIFGHETGDLLLQKVADSIRENLKPKDIVVRWGGDEFLIFVPKASASDAEELIERINRSLSLRKEKYLHISVSFGLSIKESPDSPIRDVLQEAEELMYHQKLLDGKSYRNTIITTLLATLNERSMETEEHALRLKKYCIAIGNVIGLSSEELSELSLLSMLHDVGKIGVDQNVLQKPGPLNSEEWEEMKRHSEIGYRIAQNVPDLSVVSEYILSHHERWDGKGYPRGLKTEEVPLLCRILSVVDAFDAMTSDRVYRKALSLNDAIGELEKNSGTQFDPKIVECFVNILNSDYVFDEND